jgi:glycosyltransferase involved in cell wall biosynthesis
MELAFGLRLMFSSWNSPDVILVVSPALFSSGLAMLAARFRRPRIPVIIWVQDLYSRGVVETSGGESRLGRVMASVESKIVRSAEGVVAIHDRFKSYLVDCLGVDPNVVRVIRNWTHVEPAPVAGLPQIRANLGWSPDDIVVLHAGNMGKKQGLENVVNAARLAQLQKSKVRFVLMGDGNQRRTLEAMAGGLDRLQLLPPLPDSQFMGALAAADALLVNELPGVKDMAVPSKLTSYFNAGVPVIAATDTGSVTAREIEVSGGGVRIAPADPLALVRAAEDLMSDPEAAQAMAASGLRFRNETLSERAALGRYDDFITSLASSRGRR